MCVFSFLALGGDTSNARCLRLWLKPTSKGNPVTLGYMTLPSYYRQDNPVFEISYPTVGYSPGDVIITGIDLLGSGNNYHLARLNIDISQQNPKTGA